MDIYICVSEASFSRAPPQPDPGPGELGRQGVLRHPEARGGVRVLKGGFAR